MHIAFVLGPRPEIIKLASLIKACQDQGVRHRYAGVATTTALLLTDSGGLQEEAYVLRQNT